MREKFKNALNRVRKYFPGVEEVCDATQPIRVNVTPKDSTGGTSKDPRDCAMARACVRMGYDGAIIGVGNSWLIKGKKATRYQTSAGVAREITTFDRHHAFAEGNDYLLSAVSPSTRLGTKRTGKVTSGGRTNGKNDNRTKLHHTVNIRVLK